MLGIIIGIIMGLYFKFSIVFLYISIIAIYIIFKDIIKNNRYFRYIKLFINLKVILVVIITSIISNGIIHIQNEKYNTLYKDIEEVTGKGIIVSNPKEKEYKNQYKIKVVELNNDKKFKGTYLLLNVDKKQKLDFGDEITFSGSFSDPQIQRNYGGFNYKEYLKTIKVFGIVNSNNIRIIQKDKANYLLSLSNKCRLKIEQTIDLRLKDESAQMLKGILLGDSSNIDENIKDNFRASNITHILAVSGMHVAYIVIGINMFLKSKVGKNKTKTTIIVSLIFYMFITGFSPSVTRACIMEILVVIASLVHRKHDIVTSLSLSLLLILLYNPFLIMNIGLQFSYLGTIGILCFHKNILKFLREIKIKDRKWQYIIEAKMGKALDKIKEILAVTISAQLAVLPISIYHFNLFGLYFFITNLFVSLLIGPIIILGIITILSSIIIYPISGIFSVPLKISIQILVLISKIGELPFSKVYIKTPSITNIIIYYILIIILNFCYEIYNYKEISTTRKESKKFNSASKI